MGSSPFFLGLKSFTAFPNRVWICTLMFTLMVEDDLNVRIRKRWNLYGKRDCAGSRGACNIGPHHQRYR
jgi:hypothetical protein